VESLRLYGGHKFNNPLEAYGLSIFIGTISYMVMGLSNDSSITTAPLFWCLIGIGIWINSRVKKEKVGRISNV